jgi:uncharacterized Zn finger protein (UPF0148 family)
MKGKKKDSGSDGIRVELKYCERCGSLWLRECGAGTVYCAACEREVAELPVPKKKPERVRMPVRAHTAVEDYGFDSSEKGAEEIGDQNCGDMDAAGGAA